jgi:DNA-binding NarL/FixJ family response regulator
VWASWVGLEALHAAIWGDAPAGLNRLFAALSDQPMGVREQDEPVGDLLLGRARALLLSRVGAFGAAALSTDLIAERFRTVPLARTLLWAGQLGPAVRTMELTLPDPKLLHSDRLQLLIIRGAATLLDGSISNDIRSDTVTAFRHLLLDRSYLPLAMLPRRARDAVLNLSASLANDPETSARFAELMDRLPDTTEGGSDVGLLRLTEREEILLPLLAGTESIPDIARRLHVSVHTVRTQVATLREKFQASTRAELVRKAGSYGALPR